MEDKTDGGALQIHQRAVLSSAEHQQVLSWAASRGTASSPRRRSQVLNIGDYIPVTALKVLHLRISKGASVLGGEAAEGPWESWKWGQHKFRGAEHWKVP